MTYEELAQYFPINKELFDSYLTFLIETNKKINLTSIVDKSEMILKHLYDSLLISKIYDFNNKNVLDVGSGGGFPGIPLAIMFPNARFVLMEPTHKKANFLNDTIKLLGLKNVEVVIARAEEYKNHEQYDAVISRALADLPIYLELVAHLTKINGNIIALKGSKGNEELYRAKNAIHILNLALIQKQEESLPKTNDKRINLVFIKLDRTNKRYPRLFAKIKKQPL